MERLGLVFTYGSWVDREVENRLVFRNQPGLRTLPEALHVATDLLIEDCHDLTDLGQELVAGEINIWHCRNLEWLPESIECTSLVISDCRAFKGFKGSPKVADKVVIHKCPKLETLGRPGLQLPELELINCGGSHPLHPGTRIQRSLKINRCDDIKALPGGLSVGGSLLLHACEHLSEIPEDVKVGGNLDLWWLSSLRRTPPGLEVGNDLDILWCFNLEALGEDFQVHGRLRINRCRRLASLGKRNRVGGSIDLIDCPGLQEPP